MHIQTPLVQSHELTLANKTQHQTTNVYLKLDNCQPSGSFKLRGVGYLVLEVELTFCV
jgi:threonine dehydratase